jgi:Cytochrome P460
MISGPTGHLDGTVAGGPIARGNTMTIRIHVTIASIAASAALAVVLQARAGGDKVAFPEDYAKGVLYTTVDRPDNKQYRELYTSAAAVDAAKKGQPLPNGTVITLVQYAAKLDPQGNPEKDANGRFVKTNVVAYTVMEKRTGWGAEYPDNVRNGEWEYQAFKADRTPNTGANLTACFNCHKPLDKQDFVFSYDKMKAAN